MSKKPLIKRTESGTVSSVIMHDKAKAAISSFPKDVKHEVGYLIYRLQKGEKLTSPQSAYMATVGKGVNEIRVKGEDGIYRVFYYTKDKRGILIIHAFVKKTQKTSQSDIDLGKARLSELLED